MGLREVRKELQELDKEQLIYHISELYKKYKDVKAYFDFFSNPDERAILEKYKERVHEGFYPVRGWRLKLYRSRRAINEFRKLGISPEADAELLLYFTECAVVYAQQKKPKGEDYYTRLENSLEKALEQMEKHNLLEMFRVKMEDLVKRSKSFPWNCGQHVETIGRRFYGE